jgi:uncharacterized protein YbjQ (UPF0145 family)
MTESTGTSAASFLGAVKPISAGFKSLRQGQVREYTQLTEIVAYGTAVVVRPASA